MVMCVCARLKCGISDQLLADFRLHFSTSLLSVQKGMAK